MTPWQNCLVKCHIDKMASPFLMSPWHRKRPCTWTGILLILWQMSLGQMSHKQIVTWTKYYLLDAIIRCPLSRQFFIWTNVTRTNVTWTNVPWTNPTLPTMQHSPAWSSETPISSCSFFGAECGEPRCSWRMWLVPEKAVGWPEPGGLGSRSFLEPWGAADLLPGPQSPIRGLQAWTGNR